LKARIQLRNSECVFLDAERGKPTDSRETHLRAGRSSQKREGAASTHLELRMRAHETLITNQEIIIKSG
jgi:hypothetical protein